MFNPRTVRLIAFAIVVGIGVTAGVAQRNSLRKGRGYFLTEWALTISRPVLTTCQALSNQSSKTLGVFRLNSSLKRENASLRREVEQLKGEMIIFRQSQSEANRLAGLLSLKSTLPLKTISSRVIIRPATPWAESCAIDKGSLDGVKSGAAVLMKDGLIGQVFQINKNVSMVMLLRDRLSSVSCLTERTRCPGICIGEGGELLTMDYIPANADIRSGDAIISSGAGSVFPKGLPIGSVVSVDGSSQTHFKKAVVRLSAEPRSAEEVLIITSSK